MSYNNILVAVADAVATLTINRPEVRNALNLATVQECHAALQALAADASVGVLILTGAGDKAFVAGADINDIRARDLADGLAAINSSLFSVVERFPRPTIAAVNGFALTGEIIDATRALEIGLVTSVVPAAELAARAHELAQRILRQGPLAARLAKLALNASSRVDLDSGLLIETLAQAICYDSEDKREGTTAFLEKRLPRFKGK